MIFLIQKMQIKKSLIDNLQFFFGFNNFKGDQEAIINSILESNDTFVIMPTGGGKSICYQLPALMSEGTALVISPLIALMKNQVDQLRAFGGRDSIAHFLNSSLNKTEIPAPIQHINQPLRRHVTRDQAAVFKHECRGA